MTTHTDRTYETELAVLRERLLKMAGRVEEMIADAVRAVLEQDAQLARATTAADPKVDVDEVEIDELCLMILARRQPLASDLRFIATSLKMVTDLERIGDLAVNVCERAIELTREIGPPPPSSIGDMAGLARRAVKDAMDAFVARDASLAERVIGRDVEIDELYQTTLRTVLESMRADPASIQRGVHMQAVAKFIERIGDHATNIAEEVVFLVRGTDIRHRSRRIQEVRS